jgi:hypothetical protein
MVEDLRELGYTVTAPKCGQHYWCTNAETVIVCVLPVGHDGNHSWVDQ